MSKGQFTLSLAASALAIALASPAYAQDVGSAGDDEDSIIVTAQRANQTEITAGGSAGVLGNKVAEDLPFSVRSINEALILNQQPVSLGAVLENDPTIRTSYGFGNASEQFVIRGFQLYGDDIGMNGLYGITPRQLVAPELYSQVQVLNGSSAFLNGAAPGGSGTGGSVNLVLKRADENPLNRVTLGYTSNSHFGGSFDVSRRFGDSGNVGLRVNGAFRDGEVSINDEDRRAMVLGAAFDWRSDRARLSLDLGYQKVRIDQLRPKVTIGTATIPAVPRANHNYAQDWSYTEMRDIFGIARFEYDLADNALFYATAGARDGSEDGIYNSITVTNAATGDGFGTGLYVPRTDNNEAAEAGIRVKLGEAVTHEINFGGNISWQVNRNAYDFLYGADWAGYATNIYDTEAAALPASSNFIGGDLDDPFPISKSRLMSAFASNTVGFWEDRILITGGLRIQEINVKAYAARDSAPWDTGAWEAGDLISTYNKSAITPVVGLVVKPTAGLSFYANRIEGLRQGPTAPIDATLANSGDNLKPYKSTQYEVGGKVKFGNFDAGLALYQIELPSAYASTNADGQLVYGFFGEQRNRGIEATLTGEITRGLRLISGMALTDAKLRKNANAALDGNTAQGVPEFTANANLEWDTPLPGFTLTGRVVHTGEQQVNVANSLQISDWTRFDLGARYVLDAGGNPVTLRFNVDNVANKRYWASAFDVFSSALLQGTPRTFKASATFGF